MIWIAWTTISTVQPIHVACHVIPERHDHSHTLLDCSAELWHATMIKEIWLLTILRKHFLAEIIVHDIV